MAARAIIKQWSRAQLLADQDAGGGYFIASNVTPGTALAFGVNASYDVTKNLFLFNNPTQAAAPVRMYLDYIKILPTVAPASATSFQVACQIDYVNRYTSGAVVIGAGGTQAAVNVNGDSGVAAQCTCYAATGGVITSPAAGPNVRKLGRAVARSVIPAVLDEIVLSFGSGGADIASSSGTAAGRTGTNLPPCILGPGQWLVVTAFFPSNAITALSYEFEAAWAEF